MLRRNAQTTKTAVAFQTGAMLVVLVAIVAILAQSMIYGNRTVTAAVKAPQTEHG